MVLPVNSDEIKRAVVTVGTGRGFVVDSQGRFGEHNHLVITAAHCLPDLPPCHPLSYVERTYDALLGLLGEEPTIAAECFFVDPIGDIAILGQPDGQVPALFDDS